MAALSTIGAVVAGGLLGKVLMGKGKKTGTLMTPEAPAPVDTDALTRDAASRMTALATQAQRRTGDGKRDTILSSPNLGSANTARSTLLGV